MDRCLCVLGDCGFDRMEREAEPVTFNLASRRGLVWGANGIDVLDWDARVWIGQPTMDDI